MSKVKFGVKMRLGTKVRFGIKVRFVAEVKVKYSSESRSCMVIVEGQSRTFICGRSRLLLKLMVNSKFSFKNKM